MGSAGRNGCFLSARGGSGLVQSRQGIISEEECRSIDDCYVKSCEKRKSFFTIRVQDDLLV